MADQLMFDPKTGTQYYASEAKQSAAYYNAVYNDPAYKQAVADAQAEYARQLSKGVDPQTAQGVAIAKYNPDSKIPTVQDVLKSSVPVGPVVSGPGLLYRFFVVTPSGGFETGANLPSCSRANPSGCQPQSFPDEVSMRNFAYQEGSTLVQVSSSDQAYNIIEGKETINPAKVYGRPPALTPVTPAPKGGHLATLYRFFVQHPMDHYGNQFETGATYPACSRSNPAGCQGKSFPDEASMLAFAQKEGATLIQVSSADEAYGIIEGKTAIDPSKIYTGGSLSGWTEYLVPAAIAYIAWKILF